MPEMVEVSKGYFIEKKKYDDLVYLGVKPADMRDFIETRTRFQMALPSLVGKPLKNQSFLREVRE